MTDATPEKMLSDAWLNAAVDSAEQNIMWTALLYAQDHPDWFDEETFDEWRTAPDVWLDRASDAAQEEGNKVAYALLWTASILAKKKPELFDAPVSTVFKGDNNNDK